MNNATPNEIKAICVYVSQRARFSLFSTERAAFAHHLSKVVNALFSIAMVDNGELLPGEEDKAIALCLQQGDVLEAAIERAQRSADELRNALGELRRSPSSSKH